MQTTAVSQKISQMLWFDSQAEEAANFYTSVFPNSRLGKMVRYGKEGFEIHGQKEGTVMNIEFELDGKKFVALNGGPIFKINPSVSFFATFESENQIDSIWKQLTNGGSVLMPLDVYPWGRKYGWVQDRFGVSWQINLGNPKDIGGESIVPSLMFTKEHNGQAEEAVKRYCSIFKNSDIMLIRHYEANEAPGQEGNAKYIQFTLNGETFIAMDGGIQHEFTFNEAVSFVVSCETQEEIDYYWDNLTQGGDPAAQVCGWLKDKYGVSWQIVPSVLEEMMQNPEKRGKVTNAFMKMKKFILADLIKAYEG